MQKTFVFLSKRLIAIVDFIKWTSTFGEDSIKQIEAPLRGVRLSATLSDLFGFARDEAGLMLVMQAGEAPWLDSLPISAALVGYGNGLILVTEAIDAIDQTIPQIGIEIFVPFEHRKALQNESFLGFCLIRNGHPERAGRIVPIHTPEWFSGQARETGPTSASLFSAVRS